MSFFSGFIVGQAASGKGGVGNAAFGIVMLFAVAFAILAVGAVLASLFGPLYSLVHFTMLSSQSNFALAVVAVWAVLLPLILFAYLVAIFGTRNQLWFAAVGLSVLNWMVFKTTHLVNNAPLSDWIEDSSPDEILQMELGSVALCFGALVGLHFLTHWKLSAERRQRPFKFLKRKAHQAYESKALSLIIVVTCSVGLLVAALMVFQVQDKITLAMSNGQRSFSEAFEFRVYVPFARYMLTVAVVFLLAVAASANLVRMRKSALAMQRG